MRRDMALIKDIVLRSLGFGLMCFGAWTAMWLGLTLLESQREFTLAGHEATTALVKLLAMIALAALGVKLLFHHPRTSPAQT
jgi:hypothetical protein